MLTMARIEGSFNLAIATMPASHDILRRLPRMLGPMCAVALQLAGAAPAQAETGQHQEAVIVSPLGTLVGVAATALSFPTVSLNGRYQRSYTEKWALTIAPQLVYSDLVTFENYLLGVKAGPRYAISQRYLDGWYVSPMALAGFAFTRQFGEHAQSAFVIGVGAETGYAWHWKHVVLELGGGLHYSGLVGHSSKFRGEDGKTPDSGLGPILNVSLGYGW